MRIFYITSVLGDSGGSEIYTRDLLLELIKRGHKLCIFSTEKFIVPGAKMVFAPAFGHHAFHKFEAPFSFFTALNEAKKFKPDIISSHSNSMMGLIGHFLKLKLKIPHVLLIELISSQNLNIHTKTIFLTEKLLLPRLNYDFLVVWTQNMKNRFLLPWGIDEKKMVVLPAAVNLKNYQIVKKKTWLTEKYGKHIISSIKTLWGTNAEGLKTIILAMKKVRKKYPEYKYVIFGGGNFKNNLVEFTKKHGLQETVFFEGAIDPKKCRDVWNATEISPHSFLYEFSTSISLLEYMAMGKPCVVTDVGSVMEFVGNSALVVKAQDTDAMAEGITRLIEDKKLAKSLGKKSRLLVKEKYSIEATAAKLESLYQKALKN